MGKVHAFLSDNAAWRVRRMVVHTEPWLVGRIPLVHASDIGQVDHDSHALAVRLTRAQVEANPDILLDEPVSRQIEHAAHAFIGCKPAWSTSSYLAAPPSGLGMQVSQERIDEKKAMHEAPRGGGQSNQGDPHLRSVAAAIGDQACATDGLVYHVQETFSERSGCAVGKIAVDTAPWWSDATDLMVPRSAVAGISRSRQEVRLNVSCGQSRLDRAHRRGSRLKPICSSKPEHASGTHFPMIQR